MIFFCIESPFRIRWCVPTLQGRVWGHRMRYDAVYVQRIGEGKMAGSISLCYVCYVFPSRLWISFCWVEYVFIFVTFAIDEVREQEVGINVVGFPVGPRRVSGCAQDTSWTPQKCPWKALNLLPTAYSPEQASLSAAGFLPRDFIRKGNFGESIAEYILVMPPQTLLSCTVHVNVLDEPHADLCVMTRWVEALGQ